MIYCREELIAKGKIAFEFFEQEMRFDVRSGWGRVSAKLIAITKWTYQPFSTNDL